MNVTLTGGNNKKWSYRLHSAASRKLMIPVEEGLGYKKKKQDSKKSTEEEKYMVPNVSYLLVITGD